MIKEGKNTNRRVILSMMKSNGNFYQDLMFGANSKKYSDRNLLKARRNKNDEFYTQLTDIEKELKYYREHFKGKVIFCNCDDPCSSNFTKYFALNFGILGLKKVICTYYEEGKPSYKLEIIHHMKKVEEITSLPRVPLERDGDFRSNECIEILKEVDIVVTNPPFSLFREYIAQLAEYDKKFLIIGPFNAVTYKEVFPLIKENKVWLGHNYVKEFLTPDGGIQKFGNVVWYTNLSHNKRNEKLILVEKYEGNEGSYLKYDNYNAINIDKTKHIPMDYDGVMGVPISFLDKYNPEQFEILWLASAHSKTTMPEEIKKEVKFDESMKGSYNIGGYGIVGGVEKYHRILLRRRQ
jgi:hypothetical protein